MKRATILCAVIASMSSVASAGWTQAFIESDFGPFDLVAVRMTSAGDAFEHPAHSGFSASGWALLYENGEPFPTIASASGPEVTSMTWTIQFEGASSNPLTFDFVAFHGDTIVDNAVANWNGGSWSIGPGTWQPTIADLTPTLVQSSLVTVPVPRAFLLAGIGTLLVSRVRRRGSL